jgi:hypothetical protein
MILSLLLATMAQAAPATPPAPPPAGRVMGLRAADTDGDGIVTRAEALAQADAMFARMDTDKNGTVTAEKRHAAMAARGSRRPGGEGRLTATRMRDMAGRRFDRMDTNGDGKLDAAELAAPRPGRRGGGDGAMPPPPGER